MGTQVTLDPRLPEPIHVFDAGMVAHPDAARMFRDSELLVIDGVEWDCDMQVIRSALIPQHRQFKAAFAEGEMGAAVGAELQKMGDHADRLFAKLYPYPNKGRVKSFRPMITGPEPMHFDTFVAPVMVTSFVNVSAVPRVYNIGRSFARMIRDDRKAAQAVVASCKGRLDDFSYVARDRALEGLPPLGADMPRHRVEFAPGSIWFFNPKTVSHEVVYGEGAVSYAWEARKAAPTQRELLEAAGLQ